MKNRKGFPFAYMLVLALSTLSCHAATFKQTNERVNVDVIENDFHIEQDWIVRGATRAQLMEAAHHLTLSGRYGVYGDRQLISSDLPPELQNYGDGVSAWAHPVFVPSFMGSRAATEPTPTGFRASMSGGMLGRGASDVTITATAGGVAVSERGTFSLAQLETGAKIFDVPFNLGAFTFGRIPLVLAHRTMGQLHNKMFKPVEALVNWVNDHPR